MTTELKPDEAKNLIATMFSLVELGYVAAQSGKTLAEAFEAVRAAMDRSADEVAREEGKATT